MTTFVLAIDPGTTTGLALVDLDEPEILVTSEVEGIVPASLSISAAIEDALSQNHVIELVYEGYDIGAQTIRTELNWDPIHLIGWLEVVCQQALIPLTRQPRGSRKFASPAKLKRIEWWRPTPGGHQNDATQHLLTYLAENHFHVAKELLS